MIGEVWSTMEHIAWKSNIFGSKGQVWDLKDKQELAGKKQEGLLCGLQERGLEAVAVIYLRDVDV